MQVLVEGINPEPWTAPRISVWHGKAQVYKAEQLRTYQQALSELVEEALTAAGWKMPVFDRDAELVLEFYFWRQADEVKLGRRRSRRNYADATNMLKASEDALQGLLYANDRKNRLVVAEVIDWGPHVEPAVMIRASVMDESGRKWFIQREVQRMRERGIAHKNGVLLVSREHVVGEVS